MPNRLAGSLWLTPGKWARYHRIPPQRLIWCVLLTYDHKKGSVKILYNSRPIYNQCKTRDV